MQPQRTVWPMAAFLICFGTAVQAQDLGDPASLTARDVVTKLVSSRDAGPVDFSYRSLAHLDLADLDFRNAKLVGIDLFGADLTGSDFRGVDLTGTRLDRATITRTRFENAVLDKASILRPNIFKSFQPNAKDRTSFSGAHMRGAILSGVFDYVDFSGADLTGSTFAPPVPANETLITPRVELNNANFSRAGLRRAYLAGNALAFANFSEADLREANFAGANLAGAVFDGADVSGADFSGAILENAHFNRARGISSAIGLTAIK